MAIGGTIGFALGQIISGMMASESVARSPFDASMLQLKPATAGDLTPAAAAGSLSSDTKMTVPVTVMRQQVNEAFKNYLETVREGSQTEQSEALNLYRSRKAAFNELLKKGKTSRRK